MVLGAGGTRGDFQAGALQYLYSSGVRPNIICGSSIGGINGLLLAEGEGSIEKLVNLWQSFKNNDDVYLEEPWLKIVKHMLFPPVLMYTLFPPMLIRDTLNFGIELARLNDMVYKSRQVKSFFNPSPIAAKLRAMLDPEKVHRSDIRLRIAVVSLETGKLRYITESGYFSGNSDQPVDLIDAALASSAIPSIFPPVKLHTENYVDAGTREMLPVQAAVDLGATQVYAIACSKPGGEPAPSFDGSNMMDITSRAIRDIMFDELQQKEANPPRGWGIDMKLIQPALDVHGILTVDPGLISISMAYGYMRAFDIVEGGSDPKKVENLKRISDEIIRLRLKIWDIEHPTRGKQKPGEKASWPDPGYPRDVRKLKRDLKALVNERQQLGGATATPPDVETWWIDKELLP
ncbi:MAG: patatin-like phospholipase family protein [Candidatus Methanoperedens sp.]|nr:patatin-like phospholipase family protein [Candidatus Methanoperedens sp.]